MYSNSVNSIKSLSLDQIQKAGSGHPGICLGFSEVMYVLYSKIANVNPQHPKFINRDRVVLSAGHGSAMLYSTLHLSGFDFSIEDLKNFRQFNSKTPGHPEVHLPGVDATTGPLGQGVANAVGIAIGAKKLNSKFKDIDNRLFDNYVYAIVGDGCLMEGVSFEALNIANHFNLNNLIILHDANQITLDGKLDKSTTIDEIAYFKSLKFDCFEIKNNQDLEEIERVILEAKNSSRPAYVKVNTIIGNESRVADSSDAHGMPLVTDDYENLLNKWDKKPFEVSSEVYQDFAQIQQRAQVREGEFAEILNNLKETDESRFNEIQDIINNNLTFTFEKDIKNLGTKMATRNVFAEVLAKVDNKNFLAGAADISASTKVIDTSSKDICASDYSGNNISYGIREFAMGAISNGLCSYNIKNFTSTFMSFYDYMKNSLRVSAISGLNNVFVFSHDSVFVGEDGPTHEPIEQIASLRSTPNLTVIKPVDANEAQFAIEYALNKKENPCVIVTTRQDLPVVTTENKLHEGAYFIKEFSDFDFQILASGSEVANALEASKILEEKGIKVNVVNVASFELLHTNNKKFENYLIDTKNLNIACELSSDYKWYKFANKANLLEQFGWSAKQIDIEKTLNVTNNLVNLIENN